MQSDGQIDGKDQKEAEGMHRQSRLGGQPRRWCHLIGPKLGKHAKPRGIRP